MARSDRRVEEKLRPDLIPVGVGTTAVILFIVCRLPPAALCAHRPEHVTFVRALRRRFPLTSPLDSPARFYTFSSRDRPRIFAFPGAVAADEDETRFRPYTSVSPRSARLATAISSPPPPLRDDRDG